MRESFCEVLVEDRAAMYLCGIYQVIDGMIRFVILTREANASMIEVHHRMPVIISEREVRRYLTDYPDAMDIIASQPPILNMQAA